MLEYERIFVLCTQRKHDLVTPKDVFLVGHQRNILSVPGHHGSIGLNAFYDDVGNLAHFMVGC